MDKAKEPSKQRKAFGARRAVAAPAASGVARARRNFSEPESLQGWEEEGGPPHTVRRGTAAELAERLVAEAFEHMLVARGHERATVGKRREAAPAEDASQSVCVSAELLRAARERTGIEDAAELVSFALSLLAERDPAAEYLREQRGSLPRDFRLDF